VKRAILHDGTELEFPAGTSDQEVQRAVRQRMGLPPPEPTPDEMRVQQHGEIMSGLQSVVARVDGTLRMCAELANRLAQNSHAGNVELASAVRETRTDLSPLGREISALTDAFESLNVAVRSFAERVVTALEAPKEIIKDKAGKPVRVEIVKEK
jgi:hypothetical protein